MKVRRDQSYPYRLTRYRAANAVSNKVVPPLVVVHGYTADIYGMHGLVHLLADQLRDDYAVYEYAFETNPQPKANSVSLEVASRELGQELLRVVQRDGLSASGAAFIGHSTGGVVARRAFVDQAVLWSNAAFVFLGTPHQGSEAADLKRRIRIADKQADELAVASDFLWRLNRDWAALPSNAIDRVLSVIGTKSSRRFSWGVPRGTWVLADGVVHATSAFLMSQASAKYFGLFLPLDHSELKEVPPHWKALQSLSRRWQRESPDPYGSLPAIATVQFLTRSAKSPLLTHAELWERCVLMLQAIEKDRNDAIVHEMAGWVEAPNGEWRQEGRIFRERLVPSQYMSYSDEELERSYQLREVAIGTWRTPWVMPADYEGPAKPDFLDKLRQLLEEAVQFLTTAQTGAAIIRLEPGESPLPRLISLLRLDVGRWCDHQIPLDAFVREGARWATWFLPNLPTGTYRALVEHRTRRYRASFSIQALCTTLIEIDGDGRGLTPEGEFCDQRSLSGDNQILMDDLVRGLDDTLRGLSTRQWTIAGEVRSVDIQSTGES
jgi:pimeloyl-ACP methyl ester carboxylesterase